jgi:HAE1 family hydrophobic/amphiphilic exporter-1
VRPIVITQPVRSVEDLKALLVRDVPLAEIADVSLREVPDSSRSAVAPATALVRSQDVVLLRIHRAPNANAVALARDVRARIEQLHVDALVINDRSAEVTRALGELGLAALAGVLLGTLVLRWMLGVWRPTLALAIVVPAALLASFSAFYFAGIQLDVISLAGLALATGLLVDNSIVVLESIESARAAGRADAVAAGTKQIVLAVVASSITLMIVFAPLLYLRGLARALFGEQAVAVVASVAASLLLSLTLTPVLAQRHSAPTRPRSPGLASYLRLLDRISLRPWPAYAMAILGITVALALGVLLPRELFARGGDRTIVIDAQLPPDLDVDAARKLGEAVWRATPNARSMTQQGSRITLEGSRAPVVPGVRATARTKPSAFIESLSGDADRVELVVSAASEREAATLATRVTTTMQQAHFTRVDAEPTRAALFLRWNGDADHRAIEAQVRAALATTDLGQTDITRAESAIRLLPVTPHDLRVVPVRNGENLVPLAAIANARIAQRTPVAMRDQGRPAQRLVFEGRGELPPLAVGGTERIRVTGHARELADAFAQLKLAGALAIVLLYLTVAAFYESLRLPLLVMAALPFAAAGALVALLVTGQSLNVMSLIGLVFLGGVVVNHTVVLLDRAEQLRRAGADAADAMRAAAADRYRPVLMTTITAILGMLPLAILGGPGVELRRAVAIAVTGGLVTATIGTLLIIPLLYVARASARRVAVEAYA